MSIQRILVVDDDQLSREFLVDAITALGYKPLEAKTGAEALERAATGSPDLVLADLRMPGMDGVELIKKIREQAPGVPSVMITAQGTVETAVQAMRAGASDVMLKPCTSEALEVVIERIERTARLIRENEYLRQEMNSSTSGMVAKSAPMLETLRTAARYARSKGTVLITGESGTGKERLAHYIHESSPRKNGPFIRVNCASLAEQLLLLELFGHDRSGGTRGREGRVELADGGTLLLDEIGEIPASVQARLLRLVEDEEFERLGGSGSQRVDVRILATTNRDLSAEMRAGRFREELYYRLNVLPVRIAPLRERREDVMPLAQHFAGAFAKLAGLETPTFTPEAVEALQNWTWPGNVRELENALQRSVVALRHTRIDVADLALVPASGAPTPGATSASSPTESLAPQLANRKLEEIERVSILATLQATRGNKTEAARRLGVTARTLSNKMKLWRSTGLVA